MTKAPDELHERDADLILGEEMRQRIADLLGVDANSVSVTASTGNLSGAEGGGRAISATALATVVRA